ncbi:MAG: HmuY family protein [Candidatus Kapabacteria bacterium]|nr:HmuY family protein [Candidatus Kapabacteria bacterium]MCS7169271.1 HmuY family protein [Candidatus Kapabacteria bacterium]MDW8225176.1 HmuY family protein [Bacteroidota bacterium]
MWWTLGLVLLGGFFLIGCAKEETPTDGGGTTPPQERTIRNLWVDTAKGYALLDFERGDTVSLALRGTAEWDLLLPALSPRTRSLDIFLNSGTVNPNGRTVGAILNLPYDQVTQVPTDVQLRQDDTAAARRVISPSLTGEGLFSYDFRTHVLTPLPKTVVLRTRSGKYVKVQFVSLYKDAPAQPDPLQLGYWTIRYTVSPTTSFR